MPEFPHFYNPCMPSSTRIYAALALSALVATSAPGWARSGPDASDADAIARTAEAFLRKQLATVPGQLTIVFDPINPRAAAPCTALAPFMPATLRLRARMTVGMRCTAPQPWTLYIQATVNVQAQYFVAAHTMAPGQTIRRSDLAAREGNLVTLPRGVVVDANAILGMRTRYRISAGQPVKAAALRSGDAVTRGQTVRITAHGPGFRVSSEGEALGDAPPGAPVQVRTESGQIVSGVVRNATLVEVAL